MIQVGTNRSLSHYFFFSSGNDNDYCLGRVPTSKVIKPRNEPFLRAGFPLETVHGLLFRNKESPQEVALLAKLNFLEPTIHEIVKVTLGKFSKELITVVI